MKSTRQAGVVLGRVTTELGHRDPRIPPQDRADLDRLRRASREPERRSLWIEADVAREQHALHAAAHPLAPSWESIAKPAMLEPHQRHGVDGYVLQVESGTWLREVFAQAAALRWSALLATDAIPDSAALRTWLDVFDRFAIIFDAVALMSTATRERFLGAALEIVGRDPSYEDLAGELGQQKDAIAQLPVARTLASMHLFWSDQRWEVHDDARATLHGLVGLIVMYEPLDEVFSMDGSRLLALAGMALVKPHLVCELAIRLRFTRPAALAWMLTQPPTAAWALLLLTKLSLQEQTTVDAWEARAVREHDRFLMVLREALPIFCRTMALAHESRDERTAATAGLLDALRGFARRTVRWAPGEPTPQAAVSHRQAEEVFALVTGFIAATEPTTRRVLSGDPHHVALLLGELAADIVEAAPDHVPAREIVERLRIDAELLRFLREHQAALSAQPPERAQELRRTLVTRMTKEYLRALDPRGERTPVPVYVRDEALVDVAWDHFVVTAFELGLLPQWLRLPALRAKALGAAGAEDRERRKLLGGYAGQLRTHLDVLLRAYAGNISRALGPRDLRDAAMEQLEAAIEELLLATTDETKGTVDILDEEISYAYRDDELSGLVKRAIEGVSRFSATRRERLFASWIDRTTHPSILLAIEEQAGFGAVASRAAARLADPRVLETAEHGGVVRVLEIIEHAAAAGHEELLRKLLARGSDAMERHPWRPLWEERVFGAELLLGYHRKDRRRIATAALPPSASGDTFQAREQRSILEAKREFFLALHDLEHDPVTAHASFSAQLVSAPTSAELLVNLFAAKLHLARKREDGSPRRAAFAEASAWWDGVVASVPALGSHHNGLVNQLYALDGAELDDELDRRWSRIESAVQLKMNLLEVRVANLRRRGLLDEAKRLTKLATQHHGAAAIAHWDSLDIAPVSEPALAPSLEDYRRHWAAIRVLPATDVSRIFGYDALSDYLRHVHVNACNHLLRRFETVRALRNEDRVSEIVATFVGMQLALHGWTAQEQSPGGVAATLDARERHVSGARDWIIANGLQEIAICEAMRLRSVEVKTIHEHVQKVVERYNPAGARVGVFMVYFEGTEFGRFAAAYRTEVSSIGFAGAELTDVGDWVELDSANMRAFRAVIRVDGARMMHDHVLVHLPSMDETRRTRPSRRKRAGRR